MLSDLTLSKHLFWDTDPASVDPEKHARKIIERVVTRGRVSDWKSIVAYYGNQRLREEAVKIRSLDAKSLNFLSWILHVPITDFRCYTQLQQSPKHYPY